MTEFWEEAFKDKKEIRYGQGKEISSNTFEPWPGLTLFFYDSDSIKSDFGNCGLIDAQIINKPKTDLGDKPSQRFWYIVCKKKNRNNER